MISWVHTIISFEKLLNRQTDPNLFQYSILELQEQPWMIQPKSSQPISLTKKWFVMQILTIIMLLVFSFIIDRKTHFFLCSMELVAILAMFALEGTKPYYPIYLLALLAQVHSLQWISRILIALLIYLAITFQCYEMPIVDKGMHNAGLRIMKLGQQKLAIFYPTDQKGERADWIQNQNFFEVLYDLTFVNPLRYRWVPFPLFKFFTTFLKKVKIPAYMNTKLSHTSAESKYPIILFSHGLSSNLTSHSSYFCWLASCGYIVISMQHHNDLIRLLYDKFMLKKKGLMEKIYYVAQNHDMLIRRQEMEAVYQSLISGKLLKEAFPQREDISIKSIHFNGHSFGGGTCLETLSSLQTKSADLSLFKGVICFNPWFYPLSESTFYTFFNYNITIINSETFMDRMPSEFQMSKVLARLYQYNQDKIRSFVMMGSCHIYCTDTLFAIGNAVSIVADLQNLQNTTTYFSLFQLITRLTFGNQHQEEILKQCQSLLQSQGVLSKDLCVKKQWRMQETPDK